MSLPPLRMLINAGVLRDWWKMEENFKKVVRMEQVNRCHRLLQATNSAHSSKGRPSFKQGTATIQARK